MNKKEKPQLINETVNDRLIRLFRESGQVSFFEFLDKYLKNENLVQYKEQLKQEREKIKIKPKKEIEKNNKPSYLF